MHSFGPIPSEREAAFSISTVFIKQHSVIDIACALLLCGIFYPVMQINYKDAAPDTGATHLPKE